MPGVVQSCAVGLVFLASNRELSRGLISCLNWGLEGYWSVAGPSAPAVGDAPAASECPEVVTCASDPLPE